MSTLFDSDFTFFDPTSRYSESDFLSFSSLSEFSQPAFENFGFDDKKNLGSSDASSPSPLDQFDALVGIFEPQTPRSGETIVFRTPSKSVDGLDGQNVFDLDYKSAFDELGTPVKSAFSSDELSLFSVATDEIFLSSPPGGFPWDDVTDSLPSVPCVAPASTKPIRVASNPSLGSSRNPHHVKQVISMPSLREETYDLNGDQWLDASQFSLSQLDLPQMNSIHEESLENFETIFGDFGLDDQSGGPGGPVFAFEPSPEDNGSSLIPSSIPPSPWHHEMTDMQAHVDFLPMFDLPQQNDEMVESFSENLTVNPMAVMADPTKDSMSRLSTAPGLQGGEKLELLSAPMPEPIAKRSLPSSGDRTASRSAPLRDLFSYAPQQNPTGPPGPQPLYTSDLWSSNSPAGPSTLPRAMPASPTPISKSLRVTSKMFDATRVVSEHSYPSGYPPTPNSPVFSFASSTSYPAPVKTQRAETTLLPVAHKPMRSVSIARNPSSLTTAYSVSEAFDPKALIEECGSNSLQKVRRVSMTEVHDIRQQQNISYQERHLFSTCPQYFPDVSPLPVELSAPPSVLTRTPLKRVHPPPVDYEVIDGAPSTPAPQRIHPPPHPGSSRPIARLPSSPHRRKLSSTNPSTPRTTPRSKGRSPSGKRGTQSSGGAFSFGDTMFVNFTSDDADLLLSGVAPSGSSVKRKREREAVGREEDELEESRMKRYKNID
ncbi:uncharacterized protein L203_101367 [Cryptococcus depauperatus CBS 7841]|uniref:Uncharacterized protein n=1 Tax=Cryptococcus depauperatus CBS 7841 TaxID=1295531 RepID=A0A1E3IC40_9TREE|nr:hypothetical protein L203_04272 [Cryptococcus depauperatus CBS 7841]